MAISPRGPAKSPELLEWYTVVRVADNDYRVVSCKAPLPVEVTRGPKMVIPEEIYDRWQIDAEKMLSRAIEDMR